MPKLWNETIEAHRREVGDAILETTMALVSKHGLLGVTMSRIAEETGIGRATLYKYFPSVEAILIAWHEKLIAAYLEQITAFRDRPGSPLERLAAVLESYGLARQEHRDSQLPELLHLGEQFARAHQYLADLIRDLVTEGVKAGSVRSDVPAGELASYCVHALEAAAELPSKAAVRRLVALTLAGLSPPGAAPSAPGSRNSPAPTGRHGRRGPARH